MNGWRRPKEAPAYTLTYPEVSERLRLREQIAARKAALIAEWRARNPWAPCSDSVALTLAELERKFGGRR